MVPSTIEQDREPRDRAHRDLAEHSTITSVMPASSRFSAGALGRRPSPVPTIQPAATGSRLRPIVVITVPVTTGGRTG
jgi:hypothetical protein